MKHTIGDFKGIVNRRRPLIPGEHTSGQNFRLRAGVAEVRNGADQLHGVLSTGGSSVYGFGLHQQSDDDPLLRDDPHFLVKSGANLHSRVGATDTLLSSGMNSGVYATFFGGLDKTFIVDGNEAYYYDGTNLRELIEQDKPDVADFTLAEKGSDNATGFGTGEFEYGFTFYDSTNGWETLVSDSKTLAAASKTNANRGIVITFSGSTTSPYTYIRTYRRLRGTTQWFLIVSQLATSYSGGYDDVTLETSFSAATLADVYDHRTGLSDTQNVPNPTAGVFLRGRVYLASGDTLYWSEIGLPYLFRSSGVAQKEIGDDGEQILAVASWGESVVIFKTSSTWVLRGVDDPTSFTFVAVSRSVGIFTSHAWTRTPNGLFFLGSDGQFYLFDLSPESLLSPVAGSYDLDWMETYGNTRVSTRMAYDSQKKEVYICNRLLSVSNLASALIYSLELGGFYLYTFSFGAQSNGDGYVWPVTTPLGVALCVNTHSTVGGYSLIYRVETGVVDGAASTGMQGTATGGSVSTLQDSSAPFGTTNGLINTVVIVALNTGGFEARAISSNSSTQLTVAANFSEAIVNQPYWVGGIWAFLVLGKYFFEMGRKAVRRLELFNGLTTGVSALRFGIDVDGDTDRDAYVTQDATAEEHIWYLPSVSGNKLGPFVELIQLDTGDRAKIHQIDIETVSLQGI